MTFVAFYSLFCIFHHFVWSCTSLLFLLRVRLVERGSPHSLPLMESGKVSYLSFVLSAVKILKKFHIWCWRLVFGLFWFLHRSCRGSESSSPTQRPRDQWESHIWARFVRVSLTNNISIFNQDVSELLWHFIIVCFSKICCRSANTRAVSRVTFSLCFVAVNEMWDWCFTSRSADIILFYPHWKLSKQPLWFSVKKQQPSQHFWNCQLILSSVISQFSHF